MSQIKEIITTLLNTHERGSLAYLGKYIHLTSEGKVSQEQSKQYAEMLLDYNDYLDDKEAYEGVYLSLFDSFFPSIVCIKGMWANEGKSHFIA